MAISDTALEFQMDARPRTPVWRLLARLAWRNPLGVLGALIILVLAFVALFADFESKAVTEQ